MQKVYSLTYETQGLAIARSNNELVPKCLQTIAQRKMVPNARTASVCIPSVIVTTVSEGVTVKFQVCVAIIINRYLQYIR